MKEYYQDLKREAFSTDFDYLEARVRRGLAAGYTFKECREHWYEDLATALGLTPEEYQACKEKAADAVRKA